MICSHNAFIKLLSKGVWLLCVVDYCHDNACMVVKQDELQTTTKSYEGQLSMMSEHLAGMNEKLTSQKDEIDELKYQLNNAKVNV